VYLLGFVWSGGRQTGVKPVAPKMVFSDLSCCPTQDKP
jgi:hypothetical protein